MIMEPKPDFNTAIVRNVQNDDLYQYLGDNRFKNLRTLKEGKVTDEVAQKIFKINMDATIILSKYPNVYGLINKLGLKIENNYSQ